MVKTGLFLHLIIDGAFASFGVDGFGSFDSWCVYVWFFSGLWWDMDGYL